VENDTQDDAENYYVHINSRRGIAEISLFHSMQRRRVIYDLLFVYTQQDLMDEAQHKTRKRVEEIITHQFMLLYKESE
jgi:hypothetical protein